MNSGWLMLLWIVSCLVSGLLLGYAFILNANARAARKRRSDTNNPGLFVDYDKCESKTHGAVGAASPDSRSKARSLLADYANYNVDPDELQAASAAAFKNGPHGHYAPSCVVELFDGDGEPIGVVRWDMAVEICEVLNEYARQHVLTQRRDS